MGIKLKQEANIINLIILFVGKLNLEVFINEKKEFGRRIKKTCK